MGPRIIHEEIRTGDPLPAPCRRCQIARWLFVPALTLVWLALLYLDFGAL